MPDPFALGPFVDPDWSAPLDVRAYVTDTPSHATVKGMFLVEWTEPAR